MESNCTICLDRLTYPFGRPDNCEHKFCFKCISDWLKKRSQCPLCGSAPKYLIKIDETKEETKVPVKKRTAKQFENEVILLINLDIISSLSLTKDNDDVTVSPSSAYSISFPTYLLVREEEEEGDGESSEEDITIQYATCRACGHSDNEHLLLLCDGNVGHNADGSTIRCNVAYHSYCLPRKLKQIPENEWFCPFCESKPENARQILKQTNVNVLASEAGNSNVSLLRNQTDTRQDSTSHPNESPKQNEMKMGKIECNSAIESEPSIVHDAYGGSDVESESVESNYSDEKSELYSESDDDSADNHDDNDYEESDYDRIIESSNEITVDDSEAGRSSSDDVKLECEESDETDSEYKPNPPRFRCSRRRRRTNCNQQKVAYIANKVTGFVTKMKSKSGKTVTKYQGFSVTRHHST
uniref:RING-type domain-containing protein n=1 Tax=Elaeophora elaphi TaxID=1147741 RepID=A0A0R3RK54_9BILA